MINVIASKAHYRDHLEPVAALLRRSSVDVTLVASYTDLVRAMNEKARNIVLMQHGIGQSYAGDPKMERHSGYPGGEGNEGVGLFLTPNEHSANRWREAYPDTPVVVVGSPRLDEIPERDDELYPDRPTVAVSFHWDHYRIPEMHSAFAHFRSALPALAERFNLVGHGHPFRHDLPTYWHRIGVPYAPTFAEVCRRADVYVCDNSSTLYEFASTGRPVVVMNAPEYRRDVVHGLRFWAGSQVGPNVDDPEALIMGVERAVMDLPGDAALREHALDQVYAYRTAGATRAANAVLEWCETRSNIDAVSLR